MRTTRDTLTGKPYRWNTTARVETPTGVFTVPARVTSRTADHLHPDRVPPQLLARLNPTSDECPRCSRIGAGPLCKDHRPDERVAWLQRVQLAGGTAPCRHGHVDCSDRTGGRCQDETFHQLLSEGLVDEDGDPVERGA